MRPHLLRGHLEGLLLAVLAEGPGHGYALTQRLSDATSGEIGVPEGSLYPALKRLESRRWVRSAWEVVDGRRRRVYALSASGRREVRSVAREWRSFSAAVDDVLGGLA